jgi:hypothetical protein
MGKIRNANKVFMRKKSLEQLHCRLKDKFEVSHKYNRKGGCELDSSCLRQGVVMGFCSCSTEPSGLKMWGISLLAA